MKYIGAGSAVGLAGCSDGGGGDGDGDGGQDGDGDGDVPDPDPGFDETGTDVPNRSVGGTFVSSSTSTATSLNPLLAGDDGTTNARLARMYDNGGRPIGPDTFGGYWMKDWEISDDYQKVTYTLRDGLEWGGDFGALNADDYMTLLNELVLLTGEEDWYNHTRTSQLQLGNEGEYASFNKIDDLTFEAELPVPKPQYLHEDTVMYLYVVPKEIINQYAADEDFEGLNNDETLTDGTLTRGNLGPYQFGEWARDSKWTYERNPDYYMQDVTDSTYNGYNQYYDYSDAPYFENYEVQLFDEGSTALSALQTGEVNAASIDTRKVENIRGEDGIHLFENPFGDYHGWLNMNHRINGWDPIRESKEVRQAFGEIFDPGTLVERVYQGNTIKMDTFHPAWGPFYPPEDRLYSPSGDLETARDLLEEGTSSDYGYDNDGNFNGPDGNQVELKMGRPTGIEAYELESQFAKTRFEEAGFSLNLDARDWRNLLGTYAVNSADNVDGVEESDFVASAYNGGPWDQSASAVDWDLMGGLGFGASPYSPWSTVEITMTPEGAFNLWGIDIDRDIDMSQTLTDASQAEDPETTQSLMTEAFSVLSEEYVLGWLRSGMTFSGYTDDLQGFPGQPKEWGYEASSFFENVDSSRLLGFREQ